jgi:hypothetical protein
MKMYSSMASLRYFLLCLISIEGIRFPRHFLTYRRLFWMPWVKGLTLSLHGLFLITYRKTSTFSISAERALLKLIFPGV